MSESSVGVAERRLPPLEDALHLARERANQQSQQQEGPKPWESTFVGHERAAQWLEERERKILRESAEKPLNIPKHVLRKEKNWAKFGWAEHKVDARGRECGREKVRERLEEILDLKGLLGFGDDKQSQEKVDALYTNLMQIMMASRKKPEDILDELTAREIEKYRDIVREDPSRRTKDPLSAREEAYAQIYAITHVTGSDRTQEYLTRFVYTEVFRDELFMRFNRERPQNLYELAWQITYADRDHEKRFGVNGDYPVLEMRVDADPQGNVSDGRYVVNQANFIRWMRERIMHWQDQEPDDYVDYFSKVQLKKEYQPVTLGEIINDHSLYFTDETGEYFERLAAQTLLEPWMLLEIRKYHIIYKSVMSSDKQLIEKMGEMFALNKLTKKAFGKNMMYFLGTLPLDLEEKNSDKTVGAAWNTMFLAYYNLADFDKLKQVLGEDSSFFTRKGLEDAIAFVMEKRLGNAQTVSEGKDLGTFLGKDGHDSFQKAFTNKNGERVNKIQNPKEFVKFINYFATMGPNPNVKEVVSKALKNTLADQYDFHSKEGNTSEIDTYSLDVVGLIAEAHTLFTGAGAKNDPNAAGFNALSKPHNFQNYRRKMATEARGNAMGNPFTIGQFKMLALDWVRATCVSESTKKDGDGAPRPKTVLEVMEEMRGVNQHYAKRRKELSEEVERIKSTSGVDSDEAKEKQRELDLLDKSISTAYGKVAGQYEFNENAMVNYVANHLDRARQVYEQIMSAKQIDFDKLATYNVLSQTMSFDRAGFQEQIQEKFNKQLRYMIATYGGLNLTMPVRATVFKGRKGDSDTWEYETIPLGEAMFGYEMLNIPAFRKTDKSGRYIIKDGRYVIDYNKVGSKDGLTLVWKQFALMKIGADLWSHLDKHSKDPKYSIGYIRKVLEAVESIPARIDGDEYSMKDTFVGGYLFNKEQMKWFRKLTKTTNFRLLLRGLKNDRKSKVDAGGWSDSFAILINSVIRGY